jgi:hypothetical protein
MNKNNTEKSTGNFAKKAPDVFATTLAALTLAACGNGNNNAGAKNGSNEAQSAQSSSEIPSSSNSLDSEQSKNIFSEQQIIDYLTKKGGTEIPASQVTSSYLGKKGQFYKESSVGYTNVVGADEHIAVFIEDDSYYDIGFWRTSGGEMILNGVNSGLGDLQPGQWVMISQHYGINFQLLKKLSQIPSF